MFPYKVINEEATQDKHVTKNEKKTIITKLRAMIVREIDNCIKESKAILSPK